MKQTYVYNFSVYCGCWFDIGNIFACTIRVYHDHEWLYFRHNDIKLWKFHCVGAALYVACMPFWGQWLMSDIFFGQATVHNGLNCQIPSKNRKL